MPLGFSARFGEGRFSRSRFSVKATLYGFNPLNYGKPALATGLSFYTVAGGYKKDLG